VSVSRNTVVAIERGESVPNVLLALAIAKALGTTVEALFGPMEVVPRGGRKGQSS
jgi:DNA-binding XRE family transcriptional regulator